MAALIYRYRWIIIFFFILIGAGSVILIPRIRIDPEIKNYIPVTIDSRIVTERIEKEFGGQDMIIILFSDSNILTTNNLLQIKNIDRAISRINGVSGHLSPFTVRSLRGDSGSMVVEPLIGSVPEEPSALRQLGVEMLQNPFARDIVISSDLTAASITAAIENSDAEFAVLNQIDSVISTYQGNAEILKGGLPYIRQSIMNDVARDGIILIPLALLIMLIVLKINLGKWRSVYMTFSVVLVATAFSIGLVPALDWKMSIITILVPVILIAVANNYGIYLVARFNELRAQNTGAPNFELVQLLMKSLNMPILFSGLTTIAGIAGLLIHLIIPARQVGLLAASGVFLALLMSLVFIPALLLSGSNGKNPPKKDLKQYYLFGRFLKGLSAVIVKTPGMILLVSAIILILVSSGIFFLKINTNQETYFSINHPVRQASEEINAKFGGAQTISVMINGDIREPLVMKGIDRLTRTLVEKEGVGNVFSISQVIREISKAIFTAGEEGFDKIPGTRDAIAQMFELYNMSGNPEDLKHLVNPDNTMAHVLIRVSDPDNRTVSRIKTSITRLIKDIPAEVTVGGYAVIMTDFARSIIRGQLFSLMFAVATVLILLAIIFRSLTGGLIGSVPLAASVVVLFGFMGFAGIALDAATALLSSIMIGVGVDFTIQYIWCFNLQIRDGLSYPDATAAALGTIGRSIIINAVSVMAGFSALIFSGFMSVRFFGYLVLVSISSCLIGAIVVIPAFLMKFRPGFIGFETERIKNRKNDKRNNVIGITSAAFADHGTIA